MEKIKRESSQKIKKGKVSRRTFLKNSAKIIGVAAASISFPYVKTYAQKKPIRIGALNDMTGGYYAFGFGGDRSAQAAIKRINQMGGISGRPVEYIMEDSATNVQTSIRKLRKLIMQDNCDFILGPCMSGSNIANAPVAKELNTVYFPYGTALSLTGDKGNRYIFRGINNIRHGFTALGKVAVEQLGKRYYCLAADYEWGRSSIEEAKRVFNEKGGILVGEEYSPLGTEDFIPYLNKMDPKQVDVLVGGYSANELQKLVKQAYEKGQLKNIWVIGGAMPSGIGPKDFGPAGDRIWFTGYGVQRMVNVPENLKAFNRLYRDAINMDDEGKYKDTGEFGVPTYTWVLWEEIYWIKRGIEKSGWQSKEDNLKFITALEGMSVSPGYDFIQGPKTMRAQDHQAFTDQYVTKIENGNFILKAVVKAADLYHEPTADYTKEKI